LSSPILVVFDDDRMTCHLGVDVISSNDGEA